MFDYYAKNEYYSRHIILSLYVESGKQCTIPTTLRILISIDCYSFIFSVLRKIQKYTNYTGSIWTEHCLFNEINCIM